MGDPALIYRKKLESALHEAETHLRRIDTACAVLNGLYDFPLSSKGFHELLRNDGHLAFADQMIFRFSKAQDCIGAKLFKSFLLAQGENIDRPFLDILNSLERISMVSVDAWFELREIRNEIPHDYEDNETAGINILNGIFVHKDELKRIVSLFRRRAELEA